VRLTGVPDDHRGERLVALYVHRELTPADIWQRLVSMPNRENIYAIETLLQLGTGKLDLRALRSIAERLAGIPF
jgi:acyl-[acyl-carrier-protein]-phospholipid O-acyltransferase/long-chain-fatty-acid--[acyl-carrier-protein] ligase